MHPRSFRTLTPQEFFFSLNFTAILKSSAAKTPVKSEITQGAVRVVGLVQNHLVNSQIPKCCESADGLVTRLIISCVVVLGPAAQTTVTI